MSILAGGAELLDETRDFIARFCAFPDSHCLTAVALWAAHTHMVKDFHTTPRLALLSPEAASGKTRVLDVLEVLVPHPMLSLSASPAAVFRTLADRQVTLLFDEVDAVWSKRGKDDNHEDLRALLNAGYKRGATIPRCVGPKHDVQHFRVFGSVALAGLGSLPDTIMSRSIIIRMRRRAPGEFVEPFRTRSQEPEGHLIRDRLAVWAESVGPKVGQAWPEMPDGIVDRPAEVWEPLVALADAAGGHWPDLARTACVELCKVAQDRRASLGVRLLSDLRIIFGKSDAMHSDTIIRMLVDGDALEADAPWSDLRGKPLTVRGLARMLSDYGIHSKKVRIGSSVLMGYLREHLHDAWMRYLPPVPAEPEHPEHPEHKGLNGANRVPVVPDVPDARTPESAGGLEEFDDIPF